MADYECPKCKTEYDANGRHKDDAGEQQCDECGFMFNVEIEYDPTYYATCVEHEYGEPKTCRPEHVAAFCVHCGAIDCESVKLSEFSIDTSTD